MLSHNAPYHDECEPLCRFMPAEIESYRLDWDSSFRSYAIIRFGRYEHDIALRYLYRPARFGPAQRGRVALATADWALIQDALTAADFWALDPSEWPGGAGADGVTWRIEGRHNDTYHFIHRWCPRGALWELGQVMFDLAGLNDVRV